jgi:hypothetical protein
MHGRPVLCNLQQIGIHLETAAHSEFTPRSLDSAQIAEMERIENSIESMKFGNRETATPVKLLTPDPCFTLIYLPVPILIQCQRVHDKKIKNPRERLFFWVLSFAMYIVNFVFDENTTCHSNL